MITVLGAGSWGTSLAELIARNGFLVTLWGRDPRVVQDIVSSRENKRFHPGIKLNSLIKITDDFDQATGQADMIVYASPSYAIRHFFQKLKKVRKLDIPFISTAKGIDNCSLKTLSAIANEFFAPALINEYFTVLSGPSFAYDVIRKIPTAVTLASANSKTLQRVQKIFHSPTFQVFLSDDVLGVELAGALKNVVAIATGALDGYGLGQSSRATLIARGLSEISRIGLAMGAKQSTFSGMAGLGDLVLTCTSELSRNRRVGYHLAKGLTLRQTIKKVGQLAEGIRTSKSAWKLSQKYNLSTPIIEEIYRTIYDHKPLNEAIDTILKRPAENEDV